MVENLPMWKYIPDNKTLNPDQRSDNNPAMEHNNLVAKHL